MRAPPGLVAAIGWLVAGALAFAYMLIDGATPGSAVATVAAGALVGGIAMVVARRRDRGAPIGRVDAVAIAGSALAVRGARGIRALRLADGSFVTAPATVPDSGDDRARLETSVLYGDGAARLWLVGEHRLALHGFQPQPETPPELVDGQLLVTPAIVARPESFPILALHRRSLADDADQLLTSFTLDGRARWTVPFAAVQSFKFLLVTGDRLVVVTSSRVDGCEVSALDATSGVMAWRRAI